MFSVYESLREGGGCEKQTFSGFQFFVDVDRSDDRKYVCVRRLMHPQKSSILCRSRLLFDRLFDNLVSRERNYCFGKMAQKSPEFFIPKIIFEACHMKQRL